jgi:cell division protein ZapA
MSPTNDTQVLIGGNVYTLSGSESEEYIQRVALYINNKLDEIMESDNAKQLNTRLISVLLDINIADDFFKAKDRIIQLEEELNGKKDVHEETLQSKDHIITNLQRDLSQALDEQNRLKSVIEYLEKELKNTQKELDEYIEIFDLENTD